MTDVVLPLFLSCFFFRFRIDQPVYINIIRDPINRFLSNYFFRRFGDWRGEQNHLIRTPQMKDDERYLVSGSIFISLFATLFLTPTSSPPDILVIVLCVLSNAVTFI